MSEISRRGIIKACAWSLPVVTVATASPAFATSVEPLKPLKCKPKGNRSSRISKANKTWDYHVKPSCDEDVECVWIAGEAAVYEDSNKRWSVPGFKWDSERAQDVNIQSKDGRVWSGTVVFS